MTRRRLKKVAFKMSEEMHENFTSRSERTRNETDSRTEQGMFSRVPPQTVHFMLLPEAWAVGLIDM